PRAETAARLLGLGCRDGAPGGRGACRERQDPRPLPDPRGDRGARTRRRDRGGRRRDAASRPRPVAQLVDRRGLRRSARRARALAPYRGLELLLEAGPVSGGQTAAPLARCGFALVPGALGLA